MRGFKSFRFGKGMAGDVPAVNVCAETVSAENVSQEKCFSSGRIAKLLVMALIVGIIASPLFAAETIKALDDMGTKVIGLLNARGLKAILAFALVIEFGVIAFGNSQGEGGMVKKVLPWIIGTGGILAATSIVGFFMGGVNAADITTWGAIINKSREIIGQVSDGIFGTAGIVLQV